MSEKPFECKVCHKSFHNLLNLLGHSRLHNDAFTKGPVQLRNPKRLVLNTVQISIYCSFCGKGFSGKTELLNHLKTHHPDEEIFTCNFCNESFSHRLISSHMAAHKNETSFPCGNNQNVKTKKNLQSNSDIRITKAMSDSLGQTSSQNSVGEKVSFQITAPQEGGATHRHLKTGNKQKNEDMFTAGQCIDQIVTEVVHELEPEEDIKVDRANQNPINKTDNSETASSQPSTSQEANKSPDLPVKKSGDVKQNQVARAARRKNRKLKPLISRFTIQIATSAVAKSDILPRDPKSRNRKFFRLSINEDKVKTVSQRVPQQAKSAKKRPENPKSS